MFMCIIIHVDTGSSNQLGDPLQAFEELFGIGKRLNSAVQLIDQPQTGILDFRNAGFGFALSCMRSEFISWKFLSKFKPRPR